MNKIKLWKTNTYSLLYNWEFNKRICLKLYSYIMNCSGRCVNSYFLTNAIGSIRRRVYTVILL